MSDIPKPVEVTLAAGAKVARELDIHPRTAERVMRAGLLGPIYRSGQNRLSDVTHFMELQQRRLVRLGDMSPALILQLSEPVSDGDPEGWTGQPRRWRGWAAWLSPKERLPGWSRWWQVRNAESLIGETVIAVVGPWPVEAARIMGIQRVDGLIALDVEETDLGPWGAVRLDGADLGGGAVKRNRV